jgi:hypothetical protein
MLLPSKLYKHERHSPSANFHLCSEVLEILISAIFVKYIRLWLIKVHILEHLPNFILVRLSYNMATIIQPLLTWLIGISTNVIAVYAESTVIATR